MGKKNLCWKSKIRNTTLRKKSLPCLTSVNLENNPSCAVSVPQSADIPFHLVDVYLVPDKIAFSPEKISLSFRFKMQIHGKQHTVFFTVSSCFGTRKEGWSVYSWTRNWVQSSALPQFSVSFPHSSVNHLAHSTLALHHISLHGI